MNLSTLSHNARDNTGAVLFEAVRREENKVRCILRSALMRYGHLGGAETDSHIDDVYQDVAESVLNDKYASHYEGRSIDSILCLVACAAARAHVGQIRRRKESPLDVDESASTIADLRGYTTLSAEDEALNDWDEEKSFEGVFACADALRLKVGGDIVLYALLKSGAERGMWQAAVVDGVLTGLFRRNVLDISGADCIAAATAVANIISSMAECEIKDAVRRREWLPRRVKLALGL